jgi:hypothetical protein
MVCEKKNRRGRKIEGDEKEKGVVTSVNCAGFALEN